MNSSSGIIISVLISVLVLSSSCDRRTPPPIIEIPPYVDSIEPSQPQPCYDSTFFDTTLQLEDHDLSFFRVMLPEGSFSEFGIIKGTEWLPGGKFGYGCDTFGFLYGESTIHAQDYIPPSGSTNFYTENHGAVLIAVDYGVRKENNMRYLNLMVTRSEEENVAISIADYHYPHYLNKVIETVELK